MIETVSSWILPETSEYHREPARPVERRQANFDAQFDWHTVFYDCFRVQGTQVMLIGPPLTRFEGILDSLKIHALPTGNECRYEVHHRFTTGFANGRTDNLCQILIEVSEGDICLQLQTAAGSKILDIRPSARQVFRGRRVLFTLSKNNHPTWICDWMRFHRDLHTADAVLLYDNGSTIYTVEALLEEMNRVSGYASICVVSWPYKYGPQGVGRGTWDSAFSQDGAMEDARWRYLAEAYAVLNCDIDELSLSAESNIFDQAAASAAGYVKFSGRWVTPKNGEEAETTARPGMLSWMLSSLLQPADVLDNPGKIHPATAGGVERFVDLLRVLAERGGRAGSLGGILRQREVFHHQRRGKAGLVIIIGRRRRHRARHRTIGGQRPALS